NCPPYTTLSYTWGSHRQTANITVNGRAFGIRKNLLAFLEQAARSDEDPDRLFWIDQICINQQDTEERNEQVTQMGRIYKEAANMAIWLGQASISKASDVAMSLLQDVAQWTEKDRILLTKGQAYAVIQLLERPYWSRLWIVQEISLGRKI
ncbi:heterokaryon incompatibility, partial [Lophiotrema nucula]